MHEQELFVCENCFEDPGLITFIRSNVSANECSFCSAIDDAPMAVSIHDVSKHFIECLFREYSLAVDELGWIGSEGGYIGQHWHPEDLALDELELEFPKNNFGLLLPLLFGEYYEEDWCKRNPYGLDDSEWSRYSWERFCGVVMHERRYFFLGQDRESDDPEVYSPREVLSAIFDYAQEMDLFKELPAGSQVVRARCEGSGPPLDTPQDLGPPPAEKTTQSNRMSPAGIPMFYACEDEDTAIKEISSDPGKYAVGRFETLRPITILDLAAIPPIPSLFEGISDSAEIIPRRALTFLHHIAEEMSRPIDRDDRIHINYVPTQVVTEFIRDQLTWDDTPIDGIRYPSSVNPSHVSYVLFATEGNVESTPDRPIGSDPWLRLVEVNRTVVGHGWRTIATALYAVVQKMLAFRFLGLQG